MENKLYQENISVEEAIEITLSHTKRITRAEHVPLLSAEGRILAQDMFSEIDNPPFDRSPIDGYACRSEDIASASCENPAFLKVTEEIDAGQYSERTVQKGEAVRIMTGAPIPAGCDCCVRQEDTDYGEETVAIYAPVPAHGNYCDQGEDFKKGICMLKAGEKLGYVEIANLAAMGVSEVPVLERPRIALFTTGDELCEPGQPLSPGKIYNSNYYLLYSRLSEFGMTPKWSRHITDDAEEMTDAIRTAACEGASLILTTGGVSVGKKDILHDTIRLLGAKKLFWRVRLKPGMPTIFSVYNGIPIVSLSGNPFGALANMELLVRPMLAKMTGDDSFLMQRIPGVMGDDFPRASKGRRFLRAYYNEGTIYLPDQTHPADSFTHQNTSGESDTAVQHSSGVLASMRHCNCLVDIPAGSPALKAGDPVSVLLLSHTEYGSIKTFTEEKAGSPAQHRIIPDKVSLAVNQRKKPAVFAISGIKNSGKTTMITKLIPIFNSMGLKTAAIKHDSHGFDPDVPGTDSYRHRSSGACGTAIYSDELSMIIRQESITEKELINAFPEADMILLEGFKWTDYPKIEIVRKGNSVEPVCDPKTLVGIATDLNTSETAAFPTQVPILNLNDPERIAQIILRYLSQQLK
ncbi:MAG: molybdopterin-guanine dinucleotide biosynthesis protein B [Clostridiales bacterium]|nr:molybdopterin-guanine dinucleotide biosynthesis protein B [Clostridiales bacterium]